MSNFKTTLLGAITAVGTFLSQNASHTVSTIGNIAQMVGMLLLGYNAKDNNK